MESGATCVVAVDVGGTFTDVCVLDQASGELKVAKVASTADPIDGVMAGVEQAGVDLSHTALFCHGTTVATNALITRNLPKAAMVCTRGFRDVVEIGRGTRDDLWDAYKDNAEPYIRRRDRLEVTERVDHRGEVVTELDEDEAREVARILARREVETVAVCFVNAYANGDHEQRMAEILREALPDAAISTSSGVLPELFEHERFSTTVANAVLSPLVTGYVNRLEGRLKDDGYDGDLLILHSGGGVMTPEAVQELAVRLAASGIAAGAVAARYTAALCGHDERDRRRHGRHQHRHLARLRRHAADDQRVVRRVRAPDRLPEHRGADDRRGRRLAGDDRRRRLAAQRAAVGGLGPGSRGLWQGRGGADQHRRQPRPRPARGAPGRRRDDARQAGRRGGDPRAASPTRSASSCTRRPTRSSPSPTRTWPTPCGSSRCSAATTRASSRSSSSAAPARCTARRWPRSSACRPCSSRRVRARGRRSAA